MGTNGGKGDAPRPLSVDHQTFSDNWDLVFKKPVVPVPENPVMVEPTDDLCD